MDQRPDDLRGMDTASAKEYLVAHMASLKLTEKKRAELDAETRKWNGRAELARSKGETELALAAEAEAARLAQETERIAAEEAELRGRIESMRHQLGGLAARERSVDPDLLEQELLIATGKLGGDAAGEAAEDAAGKISIIERNQIADAALEALKAKMKGEQP